MQINTDLSLKHYPYPSIEQYKNVIRNVKHRSEYVGQDDKGEPIYQVKAKPTLSFIGTPKKHGTNAAIVFDFTNGENIYFQSREHIITPAKDNSGFAMAMSRIEDLKSIIVPLYPMFNFDLEGSVIIVYGEWCGQGIQRGVAISNLPKMLVVFDVLVIDSLGVSHWLPIEAVNLVKKPEEKIYNTYDYPRYTIDIDFNYPELSQNKLVELTEEVEKQCPIGLAFGFDGIGEGIVWKCITNGYEDPGYWMKVKGEKHQSSKVKTLAPVDVEKVNNIKEFVDSVVTESRCLQSLSKIKESGKPLDRTCLGDFIRWIYNDVIKEEVDSMVQNNIDAKVLGSAVGNKAREWFFTNELNFNNLV